MNNIGDKTLGILVDELITAEMKAAAGVQDAVERREELIEYISLKFEFETIWRAIPEIAALYQTSRRCWDAQDIVMNDDDVDTVAEAARSAQIMNALRNTHIRKIDDIAGMSPLAPLEKTYG